jgi:hypothetical protein
MYRLSTRLFLPLLLISLAGGASFNLGGVASPEGVLAQEASPAATPVAGGFQCDIEPTIGREIEPDRGEWAYSYPHPPPVEEADPESSAIFVRNMVVRSGDAPMADCIPGQAIFRVSQGAVLLEVKDGFARLEIGGDCQEEQGCVIEPGSGPVLIQDHEFVLDNADFVLTFASPDGVDAFVLISGSVKFAWLDSLFACDGGHCVT